MKAKLFALGDCKILAKFLRLHLDLSPIWKRLDFSVPSVPFESLKYHNPLVARVMAGSLAGTLRVKTGTLGTLRIRIGSLGSWLVKSATTFTSYYLQPINALKMIQKRAFLLWLSIANKIRNFMSSLMS
jgi:hypothetical protein